MRAGTNNIATARRVSGHSEQQTASSEDGATRAAAKAGIVLTMGDYHGTLAATRSLGRDGIAVTLAESSALARARWSRWAASSVSCPSPAADADAFVRELLEIGRLQPGLVLYPTSDDTTFLYALHADELSRFFLTYQPHLECVYALLNKKRLFGLCGQVGLDAPETWFPNSEVEVDRLAETVRFPVLLKPQTQIQFAAQIKGFLVPEGCALAAMYRDFVRSARYGAEVSAYDPAVRAPMVQRYHGEAVEGIYSLAGFVDASGRVAARGASKVYQRPRKFGVGVCFESAPVRHDLLEKIRRLCALVGYRGVFEVEFIEVDGRALLIDFNPRFYGQMGFDIARGLPLARLAYEAAVGNEEWVGRTLVDCAQSAADVPSAYCHRFVFGLSLALSSLAGTMRPADRTRWRRWYLRHRGNVVDAMHADDDAMPAVIDKLSELIRGARHPRSFFRSLTSNRT